MAKKDRKRKTVSIDIREEAHKKTSAIEDGYHREILKLYFKVAALTINTSPWI